MSRIISFWALFSLFSCHSQTSEAEVEPMINGLSYVSVNKSLDSTHITGVEQVGANWVAVIPYAYMPAATLPQLIYNTKWQWHGERLDGARETIQLLHKKGVSVMVKPQVWVGRGVYTGTIDMEMDSDWEKLEKNYRAYLLDFAKMAEDEGVEMLCIGTELRHFVNKRPDFWRELVKEIREIYKGKLTYASNWDDFDEVVFWSDLDYVGVDAYFPVAEKTGASVEELKRGWEPHLKKMDTVCAQADKPLLFTEYGYRSITNCAVEPWDYSKSENVDEKAQCAALKALYEVMWGRERFAGGFLWKWYPEHKTAGGSKNNMFTVQNKEAEKVVRKAYMN